MIELHEAFQILKNNSNLLGTEKIPLSLTANRVLAEDIIAEGNYPPYNRSCILGYACKKEDLPGTLKPTAIIQAGDPETRSVGKGECMKVMSGAMIPEGADCIVTVGSVEEDTRGNIIIGDDIIFENISKEGNNKKDGELILKEGSLIKEKHIGMLASAGIHTVNVVRQPLVTVFSTGSELVEPEDIAGKGQIRNANGPQLLSQLQSMGISGLYGGITDDDTSFMEIELARSIENFDGLIITGGSSGGNTDLVPSVLKKMGFDILFYNLNINPGKPVLFAVKDNKFCFGIPGNPVSTYILFELLIKKYLYQLMGYDYTPLQLKLPVGEDIENKESEKEAFIPVSINEKGEIIKIYFKSPDNVFAMGEISGILHIPIGISLIKKGDYGSVSML